MPKTLIDVVDVAKVYDPYPWWMRMLARTSVQDPVVALDGVSFSVAEGEMCAVIGPNGAGKSTLFRVLTGLTTPTEGTARVAGLDATTQSAAARRHIGFMPADDRTLFLRHTCVENLDFHGRLQGIPQKQLQQRIADTLELVGLTEARHRAGHALSSGMKARLQLARAILHEPRVLILDEPTGAVDPLGAYELLLSIVGLTRERNLATLISSHRLEEIEALRDNVLLLDRGAVVFWGDLQEVRDVWEVPRLRLRFRDGTDVGAVAAGLASSAPAGVEISGSHLLVTGFDGVGSLLEALGANLGSLAAVEEERLLLRDLLGMTFGQHGESGV